MPALLSLEVSARGDRPISRALEKRFKVRLEDLVAKYESVIATAAKR